MELVVEPVAPRARGKALTCGILGDVNNDELVDVNDALLVLVFHLDPSITAPNGGTMGVGDVTADGQVNLDDVLVLMTYLTNASDASLPAGIGQATSSCSNEPGVDDMTAEEAQAELARRGIASTAATFIDSAGAGNLEVVKLFVSAEWSVDVSDAAGWTLLHAAARGGSVEVVQYLVQQGASLEATDNDGWTLLHAAARGGSVEVVQYLVQQGASLEATDNDGGTLLHAAAWGGSCGSSAVSGSAGSQLRSHHQQRRDAPSRGGPVPLVGGSVEVVQYLVQQGASLEATDNDGWTPLLLAAVPLVGGSVEYLQQGASLEATDNAGRPFTRRPARL